MEYIITSDDGKLGQRFITAGNVEKLRLLFCQYLDEGVTIASVTTGIVAAGSSISAATLSEDKQSCWAFITAGADYETFEASMEVTLTDGQVLNYTLGCVIKVL